MKLGNFKTTFKWLKLIVGTNTNQKANFERYLEKYSKFNGKHFTRKLILINLENLPTIFCAGLSQKI